MWSTTLANLKEDLNKIALDVHDDDDDDDGDEYERLSEISNSRNSSFSDRRFSRNHGRSGSPMVNGLDSTSNLEIDQCKAEIKRLQESEAQIKALSVNYAALLKEREKNRSFGKRVQNGVALKEDAPGNGVAHSFQPTMIQNKMGNSTTEGNEKELSDLLEEKSRSLAALQVTHEQQIKQLREELDKERGKLASLHFRFQEEQKLNRSFQEEENSLKADKENMLAEMNKIRDELSRKLFEIRHLQMELNRRENAEANDVAEDLRRIVATLEKENSDLKMEKNELKVALEVAGKSLAPNSNGMHEQVPGSFPGKEELESSLQKLEKDLKETSRERDKALQQLNRLKQHLLEKESEDSEKMDEDSKIIEGLRENNENLRAQIRHLEKSLDRALAGQEEVKMTNNNELQKSKEIIDDLSKKVASLRSLVDAKNVELLNLQTALGQYYAEIEAKEHLERELASAREESARLSEHLKEAFQQVETAKKEKEECLEKLSQAERLLAEGKGRVNKLEEDNTKLRRALEQSMTRLNRMSMDSDFSVDRRIVIKLLVTYFQRNHSKEVLDLMVRMLGFSEEDKQRIGLAQQGAGKSVVRGVFGLPGRLVGGILGGAPADNPANVASDNQSFADMWVDFLLKEGEEREKRESSQNVDGSRENQDAGTNPVSTNIFQTEQRNSEFSTVPLASPDSNHSRFSRQIPRY
ncbi:golgin candidate 4 isoform X3 [Cynara cardunculus var. scolymus]|uniref:golgin candidate 4 isoform X3 n=1 Tax=Cynara cardunculus var. scolymus TaxID=59895 RepID=UPI000D628521|nr:golgin candidate 4 isoform X3 [Cynara cardunculus var. scolymus]